MRRFLILLLLCATPATAATYYVDCNDGIDTNTGLSETLAWKTVAKVNASSFSAGDSILFKRGCVWYESLVVPSSGAAGNPIVFAAYSTGEPPTFDGAKPLTGWAAYSVAGSQFNENRWRVATDDPYVVGFDGRNGVEVAAVADLDTPREWYYAGGYLYVYSHRDPVKAWTDIRNWFGYRLIQMNAKNYVTLRHLRVRRYNNMGMYINGTGNTIEYCEMGYSQVDASSAKWGMYVSTTGSITVANCTFVRPGLYGIQTNSTPTLTVKNCVFVGAHGAAISATGSTTTYSNSYVQGNALSNGIACDYQVVAATDGGGQVDGGIDTFAALPRPLLATIMMDDAGDSKITWLNGVTTEFQARECPGYASMCPFGMAVYCGAAITTATYQGYYNAGHDLMSHGWSHVYAVEDFDGTGNDIGLRIQYVGTGNPATMTVTASGATWTLATTITGGPGGEDLSLNLKAAAYDTGGELCTYIDGLAAYTCSQLPGLTGTNAYVHTVGLDTAVAVDIKTAAYDLGYDKERTVRDDIRTCVEWHKQNITGRDQSVNHVWPGGSREAGLSDVWFPEEGAFACGKGSRTSYHWWDSFVTNGGCYPRESVSALLTSPLPSCQVYPGPYPENTWLTHIRRGVMYRYIWEEPLVFYTHEQDGFTSTQMGTILDHLLSTGVKYTTVDAIARDFMSEASVGYLKHQRGMGMYRLVPAPGSVLINAGLAGAAGTAIDILGNPVMGLPDIGAYEYRPVTVD